MTIGLKVWDAAGNLTFGPHSRPSRYLDSFLITTPSGSKTYGGNINDVVATLRTGARGGWGKIRVWAEGKTVYWADAVANPTTWPEYILVFEQGV